jgi:methylated-DNA-protein-cysteine methyltransferase-like protein
VTGGPALVHNPARMPGRRGRSGWERIYAVVRRIPRGRVATYGDVAALAGMPGRAREVGYALHALEAATDVPWQRVINARGEVSARGDPAAARMQRALLEREGVVFGPGGRVDLAAHGWRPRSRRATRLAAPAGRRA